MTKKPIKKMSVQQCREYLKKNKREYTDEQVIQIRDLLYQWAQIDYEVFIHNEQKEKAAQEAKTSADSNQPTQ